MNATYIKQLLEPIPSEDFITYTFTDKKSKCCALGHLKRITSFNPDNYSTYNCSLNYYYQNITQRKAIQILKELGELHGISIYNINDGENTQYNQPNPKARIMAFLDHMIAKGY